MSLYEYESVSISCLFKILFTFYYHYCLWQYYCPLAAVAEKCPSLQDK